MLFNVTSNFYSHGFKSDHKVVNIDINLSSEKRGPGYWKFNNSLLSDNDYVELINDTIEIELNNCIHLNDSQKWEYIKYCIRKISISHSKKKANERRSTESSLIKTISDLEQLYFLTSSHVILNDLNNARNKLESIYSYKINGIIVRSRARWVEDGERSTSYFLNLEKRHKSSNVIRKLKDENGVDVNANNDILNVLSRFYKNLYRSDYCSPDVILSKINACNLLTENVFATCDDLLTELECKNALFSMKNGKSPGSDGLSADFYKVFWPAIGQLVVNSLNHAFMNGTLSHEQGRGIISLILKPGKDPLYVKNYRPISLLNTDYKICSKALAFRIKDIVSQLVDVNQTGFVKNRFIGENIRFILDTIHYCKTKGIPGFMLFIDFENAFDRLDWGFIFKCLSFYNFNVPFINWIRTLYSNATACVFNNGFSSSFFKVSRGVRQGCPISPYLFILCANILSIFINSSRIIKGISVENHETKIISYADDTTIFLDGSYSSLSAVVDAFKIFQLASGLKVNFDQTYIFPLGPMYNNKPHFIEHFDFPWSLGPITTLGITFDNHEDNFFHFNYTPKLSRLKKLLNLWSQRDLTPMGKITIVKSFGLSQFVYLFQTLPNPPNHFLKALETCIFNFIWSGKPDKVKRSTLIAPIVNGGLNATHLLSFVNSLKCSWVKRYFDNNSAAWKDYFDFSLKGYGKALLFKCNFKINDVSIDNFFIYDVCKAWSLYAFHEPQSHFMNEYLWNNHFIRINNRPVFYKFMYIKNVFYVKDLFDENNRLLTYKKFQDKFDLRCYFTTYFGLLSAIPNHWKTSAIVLDNNVCILDETINRSFMSRVVYRELVKHYVASPSALAKWNVNFTCTPWDKVFQILLSIREPKLRYFQFRFLHRILGTNVS